MWEGGGEEEAARLLDCNRNGGTKRCVEYNDGYKS